jgi:hypothetical protein
MAVSLLGASSQGATTFIFNDAASSSLFRFKNDIQLNVVTLDERFTSQRLACQTPALHTVIAVIFDTGASLQKAPTVRRGIEHGIQAVSECSPHKRLAINRDNIGEVH